MPLPILFATQRLRFKQHLRWMELEIKSILKAHWARTTEGIIQVRLPYLGSCISSRLKGSVCGGLILGTLFASIRFVTSFLEDLEWNNRIHLPINSIP